MASVSSSSPCSPQAVLLLLPLPLHFQPRCRLPRLPLPPLGLTAGARRGGGILLPLPAPRAAEGNDGRTVAKEEENSEEEERGGDAEGAGVQDV